MTIADQQILNIWFSPNFPTGSFSFSHGLDALFGEQVHDLDSLELALRYLLHNGGPRNDAIFLQLAMREPNLRSLNHYFRAYCAGQERWEEALTQGSNFAKAVRQTNKIEVDIGAYPLVVGQAARLMNLQPELTTQYFLQAVLSNLAMIASRLVPLSVTMTNAVLMELRGEIEAVSHEVKSMGLADISSTAVVIDIASLLHETQKVRLCKT